MKPRPGTPAQWGYLPDYTALIDPIPPGMDKNFFETQLSQRIDSDAAKVHVKLVEGMGVSRDDYPAWAYFLFFLRLREPEIIAHAKEGASALLLEKLAEEPDEYDAVRHAKAPPTLTEWVRMEHPGLIENIWLSCMTEAMKTGKALRTFLELPFWVADFSEVNGSLLLGDRPLVLMDGLDHPNFTAALPISPKKAFIGTPNRNLQQVMMTAPRRLLLHQLNKATLFRCREHVFAANRENDPLIQKVAQARARQQVAGAAR